MATLYSGGREQRSTDRATIHAIVSVLCQAKGEFQMPGWCAYPDASAIYKDIGKASGQLQSPGLRALVTLRKLQRCPFDI